MIGSCGWNWFWIYLASEVTTENSGNGLSFQASHCAHAEVKEMKR
jgi:hypothetical protein